MKYLAIAFTVLASFATAADSSFCDTPLAARYFSPQSIMEYRVSGPSWNTVAQVSANSHESLNTVPELAEFLEYKLLNSWSASCNWTNQNVTFRSHTPDSAWANLDSTLWTRYIDTIDLQGASGQEWLWFQPDTLGWKTAPITSDAYMMAAPMVRWQVFATRADTLKDVNGTTIFMKGKSLIRLDSAEALTGLFDAWGALETAGHTYLYQAQVIKITYAAGPPPVAIAKNISQPSAGLKLRQQGRDFTITLSSGTLHSVSIHRLNGQSIFAQSGRVQELRWTAPEAGLYLLRVDGRSAMMVAK
jgi:hypothetical protein